MLPDCLIRPLVFTLDPAAAEAVNWTRTQLTEDDRQWLRDLKYSRMVTNFTIVHATLDGPQRWGYVFDKLAAAASFTSPPPIQPSANGASRTTSAMVAPASTPSRIPAGSYRQAQAGVENLARSVRFACRTDAIEMKWDDV